MNEKFEIENNLDLRDRFPCFFPKMVTYLTVPYNS
jgi:hypothetical protein